jgi:AraC-like DNA-binding protein
LVPLVERLWLCRTAPAAHAFEWILPDGHPQVLFNLVEDELRVGRDLQRLPGAVFQGPFDAPFVIDTRQQQQVAGITFHPGALGSWVLEPDIAGARLALQDVFRGDLRDWVLSGRSDASVLDRLETVMVDARLRGPDVRIAAAARALDAGASVGLAAAGVGMGSRQFRERFRQRTGLLPKRYARVRRLQRVLAMVGELELGEVAFRTGFSDQAHLSREFRALTGVTATAYGQRVRGHRNHVLAL